MTKLRLVILILAVATFALPRNVAAEWPAATTLTHDDARAGDFRPIASAFGRFVA